MDRRLLEYYRQELQYIREMGVEFARENPKIAQRLGGLTEAECTDPYVERLLEGFAFLTARIQLRIDSEFPRFTQQLLQMVYPDYLCPMPSMAIAQFNPDYNEAGLAKGFGIPRGSTLLSTQRSVGASTACQYRTAHAISLWPIRIASASYRAYAADFPVGLSLPRAPQAVLRIRLSATANLKFNQIALSNLPLYLCGPDNIAHRLYESILGSAQGVFLTIPGQRRLLGRFQGREAIQELGFDDEHALLPHGPRTFQGHRLLQEYLAFPARALFVELRGLGASLRVADTTEIELTIPLDHHESVLEHSVTADDFALYCTPVVNLFDKTADRIHLDQLQAEHHVVPDRTRPTDFEVYSVSTVTGYGEGIEAQREFMPFYSSYEARSERESDAYFTMRRTPRMRSEKERRVGPRSNYLGSEVYLSLVDGKEAPFSAELRQLGVEVMCTNRDLPLLMPTGTNGGDFVLDTTAPLTSVQCKRGPTPPVEAHVPSESSWRLIGLLSQNYLSLLESDSRQGAASLREILSLFVAQHEVHTRRQLSALRSVACEQVVRRLPTRGPVAFGRGMQVAVEIDENALGGSGAFTFGSVLRHYFCRHVSLNSFVETVLKVTGRGEVMKWPPRIGARAVI